MFEKNKSFLLQIQMFASVQRLLYEERQEAQRQADLEDAQQMLGEQLEQETVMSMLRGLRK